MPESTDRSQLANLLMLITTACWAGNVVAGKEALTGFSPVALAQVRVIAAAAIFAALAGLRHRKFRLPARGGWLGLVLSALTGVTLNQFLFIGGLARTSALHAGLVVGLGPVIVLILSAARGQERITFWKLCGIAIAFLGMGLLVFERAGEPGQASWVGDLIVLSGSTAFAFFTILVKETARVYDDLTLNAGIFVIGAVLMLPFGAAAMLSVPWRTIPERAWLGLAFMAVCGSVIGYVIYGYALRHLSASRVAAFTYLQPVIAAALAVWIMNESITALEVFGGVLIIAGMYLTRERGSDRDASAAASDPLRKPLALDSGER